MSTKLILTATFLYYALAAAAQTPVPLAKEHHHKILLDNAYIRVLDGHVAAHDTTPPHIHSANSVVIFLSPSTFGIQNVGQMPVITTVKAGDFRYSGYGDKPVTHIVWEQSPSEFHFFVVELKHATVTDCPPTADLKQEWHQKDVTAYTIDLHDGRPLKIPAENCAWFSMETSGANAWHFYPPKTPVEIKGNGRYILLQL